MFFEYWHKSNDRNYNSHLVLSVANARTCKIETELVM